MPFWNSFRGPQAVGLRVLRAPHVLRDLFAGLFLNAFFVTTFFAILDTKGLEKVPKRAQNELLLRSKFMLFDVPANM